MSAASMSRYTLGTYYFEPYLIGLGKPVLRTQMDIHI